MGFSNDMWVALNLINSLGRALYDVQLYRSYSLYYSGSVKVQDAILYCECSHS